jgi:cysteine desulfurase
MLSRCHENRGIVERIPSVVLNGDPDRRYIGNLNFSFAYVEGESLLMVSCWL